MCVLGLPWPYCKPSFRHVIAIKFHAGHVLNYCCFPARTVLTFAVFWALSFASSWGSPVLTWLSYRGQWPDTHNIKCSSHHILHILLLGWRVSSLQWNHFYLMFFGQALHLCDVICLENASLPSSISTSSWNYCLQLLFIQTSHLLKLE